MTAFEGQVEIRGTKLAYDDAGQGALTVYAHGMMQSRRNEDRLGLFDWTPLVAAGRLVRYDARGHGLSGGRPDEGDYTWANLAGDLLAVADHFGSGLPVNAVGASMGCGTLLHAAVTAPDRFNKLALVIPPTAWETRAAQGATYRGGADLVESKGKQALLELMGGAATSAIFADSSLTMDLDVTEELLPSVLRGAGSSNLPEPEAIAKLEHQVLVLAWDADPIHPLSTAERLAGLLPNAELHVARTREEIATWGDRIAAFL
ncbi:alpha/beta fold hydrolase [Streptosporangium sp. NPDC000396]|uniref:alpha/beta fold hydrolase n=1 Tax=Streptosporangium sp. NPDC000396 TaxID=3366185 RepID=UPI0036B67C8E